jgi:hypothetical protein
VLRGIEVNFGMWPKVRIPNRKKSGSVPEQGKIGKSPGPKVRVETASPNRTGGKICHPFFMIVVITEDRSG